MDTGDQNPIPSACHAAIPGPIEVTTTVGENEYAQFRFESVDWALGLVHAKDPPSILTALQGSPEHSPSWFSSMAFNATEMDCIQPGGCDSFLESNHGSLLCDLYAEIDCNTSSMEEVLGLTPLESVMQAPLPWRWSGIRS